MKFAHVLPLLAVLATTAQAQNREVNVICSAQAAWCSMIAVTFEKSQGIKVNMTAKGSGEALAQLTAEKAVKLIQVDYEVLPHVLTAEEALAEGAPQLHENRPGNVVSAFGVQFGDIEAEWREADHVFEGDYETSVVQHCHLESMSAFAYVDADGRIVVNSSTQIPHIVRRIVSQALGLSWGRVKVIKPYIGGGFGNKQDVVVEPLAAAMSLAAGCRPVRYCMPREEVFVDTRTRHGMKIHVKTAVSKEGVLKGVHMQVLSNTGAYASHGHSIAMSAGGKFRPLYNFRSVKYEPKTVYTNLPVAGAMRGYGTPQIFFALESHLDDVAKGLGLEPLELRRRNLIRVGHQDPLTKNIVRSFGIPECLEKGMDLIQWDEKRRQHAQQTGPQNAMWSGLGNLGSNYLNWAKQNPSSTNNTGYEKPEFGNAAQGADGWYD